MHLLCVSVPSPLHQKIKTSRVTASVTWDIVRFLQILLILSFSTSVAENFYSNGFAVQYWKTARRWLHKTRRLYFLQQVHAV